MISEDFAKLIKTPSFYKKSLWIKIGSWFKTYTFSDINKHYANSLNYKKVDDFTLIILIWHLFVTFILVVINSYTSIPKYFPSPLGLQIISKHDGNIAFSIAFVVTLTAILIRKYITNHYLWRVFISLIFIIYSYIFIFLGSGSIEMYFHTFMLMAYLIIYADWRLQWIVFLLAVLHRVILNLNQASLVFFYGQNDLSVISHFVPVLVTASFSTVICHYNRRNVIILEDTKLKLTDELVERKKIQQELQNSEHQLEIILQGVADGITAQGLDGKLIYANDAAAKAMGLNNSIELLSTNPLDLVNKFEITDENGQKLATEELPGRKALAGESSQWTVLKFKFPESNQDRWSAVKASPVLDENDKVLFVVNIFHDITQLRENQLQIEESLKEKNILLKEVHHRVKNNLQIIFSLLNLQSNSIDDQKYLDIFKKSQNRIRSMAMIHEKLYQSTNLSDINFGEYIKGLSSDLFSSYQDVSKNIALNFDIENDVYLNLDFAVPCGLILNELISNSLKYAFVENSVGSLNILIKKMGNEIRFSVCDTGPGLSENLDLNNIKSLGLKLVQSLVSQIHGKLEIRSDQSGAKFDIFFSSVKLAK